MGIQRFGSSQPSEGKSAGAQMQRMGGMSDGNGAGMMEEGQDGKAVAAEHGPATETHTMHDHEGGKHSVHTKHPDGHEHHSEHGSADEAHSMAADCSGSGGMGNDEKPEYE